MFRTLYLVTFMLLSMGFKLCAQHCGWDNTNIILVEVRDSATNKIINGLEIVLADSTGKPYRSEWNLRNNKSLTLYQHTDILKFGQNTKSKYQNFSETEGPFPFGVGCYMLLVYGNNYRSWNESGKDLIIINDVDGEKNGGYFEGQRVMFNAGNITSLCTGSKIWSNSDTFNRVKIVVMLKRIK